MVGYVFVFSQATALVRQETLQTEQEAKDLMDATLLVRAGGMIALPGVGKQRVPVIEKVRVESHLKVIVAKNLTTCATLNATTEECISRLLQIYGQELPEAANEARNGLIALRTKAIAGLALNNDSMREHLERVAGLSDCAEMAALSKQADAELKETTKVYIKPFNSANGSFKKMLTAVEREQKLGAPAGRVPAANAAKDVPPLFVILRLILEAGDINSTNSLFEAKQGHRVALLPPKACPKILGIGGLVFWWEWEGWD
jgi:hypothetical protein